jgi:hypothetical protein
LIEGLAEWIEGRKWAALTLNFSYQNVIGMYVPKWAMGQEQMLTYCSISG